jgi:hypothetical protein
MRLLARREEKLIQFVSSFVSSRKKKKKNAHFVKQRWIMTRATTSEYEDTCRERRKDVRLLG